MTWYSQAGQDEWVQSIVGDSGFFVDVGAHDGIVHSNTYALEQLGWTGLCIEPNRAAWNLCRSNRTSPVFQCAVSDGAESNVPFDGIRVTPEAGDWVGASTLSELLASDEAAAPPVVDYLSIDVEGHELEVLAGMDFDRWHVRCATIEHNAYCDGPSRKEAIAAVMLGHGFECFADDIVAEGYGEYESWWVNRDD